MAPLNQLPLNKRQEENVTATKQRSTHAAAPDQTGFLHLSPILSLSLSPSPRIRVNTSNIKPRRADHRLVAMPTAKLSSVSQCSFVGCGSCSSLYNLGSPGVDEVFVNSKLVSGRLFARDATSAHKKKGAGDREEVCLSMI